MRIRQHDATALAFFLKRLKSHLRISANDLDDELVAKLCAAIDFAEHHIGRIILKSTLIDTIPFSPVVTLSRPLLSVDGIEVDGTSVSTESCEADVFAGTVSLPQAVQGKAVKVTYEAGMVQPPADIVEAILLVAAYQFTNPMDSVDQLQRASMRLLRPHRNYGM